VPLQTTIFTHWGVVYHYASASEAEELVSILSFVRDHGRYPFGHELPEYVDGDTCGGSVQVLREMEEQHGFELSPEDDFSVEPYFNFIVEAEKQGFIFILPLEPRHRKGICEIYHLSLPVDRDIIFGATPGLNGNTDLCDIIISYTNWPGLWEALYGKVSGL
jgi:hypothetical protein